MKVEPLVYGDRKVFAVSAFNRGVAMWLREAPRGVGRGRAERAAAQRGVGVGLLHAQGSAQRRDARARRCSAGASTRSSSTSPRARRCTCRAVPSSTSRKASSRSAPRRSSASGSASTSQRSSGSSRRSPQRGPVRGRAKAAACRGSRARSGCSRARTPQHAATSSPPSAPRFPPARLVLAETRVQGAGAPRRHRRLTGGAGRTPGGGRRHRHAWRRQLRGSPALQRRARRAGVRGAARSRSSRPSGTSRTHRSATSPPMSARRRRPRRRAWSSPIWTSCWPGLARSRERLGPVCAGSSSATASGWPDGGAACARRPGSLLERRRAALTATGGRLRTLSPQRHPRPRLRDRPLARGDPARLRRRSSAGDGIDVELARGSLAATVEDVISP